jgi:hypothetical protein
LWARSQFLRYPDIRYLEKCKPQIGRIRLRFTLYGG